MVDPRSVLDVRATLAALNICRTSLYKLLHTDPDFPAPITIAGKLTWFLDEIEAYKESRPRRQYAKAAA